MTDTENTTSNLPDLNLSDDPLDSLTVVELRVANGKLRGDVAQAITAATADRWDALALVGWLHHKRIDPGARLEDWTALTARDLLSRLNWTAPAPPDEADDSDGQEVQTATMEDVVAAAKADPTAPTDGR